MIDSPKDKVRANIYKKLLEEEKRRNKKISVFSFSLFIVGVFTGTTYDMLFNNIGIDKKLIVANKGRINTKVLTEKLVTIDEFFQNDGIKVKNSDFSSEKLFVTDLQI